LTWPTALAPGLRAVESDAMVETTCAACDCKLDVNSIKVKIGGKTVEVCCEDCARRLKEAHASATGSKKRQIMKRNKAAVGVPEGRRPSPRLVAAWMVVSLIISPYLAGSVLARANDDAPGMDSAKTSEASAMNKNKSSPIQHSVQTASGRISYTEQGTGPVALFVHGVLLNGYLWRHQLADLSDMRRCIAVDLLAHGDTEIAPDQDVSVTANAKMLKE